MVKEQIRELLNLLGFKQEGDKYTKEYKTTLHPLIVDVEKECIYYANSGITVTRNTTSNLSEDENLVVLECVDRLLSMGYHANHIELEPHWKMGHGQKGGFADIWVRSYSDKPFDGNEEDQTSWVIIECKTAGAKYNEAWNDTLDDGAQLFSYFQQEPKTMFLCLYTSDIVDGKLKAEYKLINVQDNEDLLASDKSAQSYKDKNDKQRYRVWRDTYDCEYATRGLFEKDIQPYEIGKNKYTIADLAEVDNSEIQKKYHEFALILRQHNVSGRENAFDKLVNLFLAKVVDETNNPEDLHFYWKGTAYDDDFQLQDRLQRLYRDGMMRFLKEEVTYIENSEIDKAFRRFKNDPDATKKTIMEYFRALKFFSDNDFSFISVHNEKLFRQNAVVLRKMVKMLQDIRLKTNEAHQNQFLGDLFEGFLNRGIKQSEGQFFTPMPIVRFIVSSLPLEHVIRDNEDIPWAIDYACGAGHFLTEYAVRIKEFVEKYRKDIPLKEYYSRITGIEKEYRLTKVSKVSAFMYGHDDINIVYADALVKHPEVHEGQYEVLVANPPYAVSGFLDTLTEEQRKQYTLFNESVNTDKNNVIEAFFIERAAQLMKTGGVAGIILPVSVLNRNGIHAHAREIILQNFDVVALAEFGSGTFGQTGTNTVTMFLRRKETNTPDAEHYKNRVNSWFAQREETNAVYQDEHLLGCYCNHCDYQLEDYKTFIGGVINDSFLNTETVQAYNASFFGNQRNAMKDVCEEAKSIRNKFLARSKTRQYKELALEEQNRIKEQAFLNFVTAIEKEKVYYFVLANTVTQPVLLIKSPTSNADIKKFLGYGWSGSKGNEGIQYLNVASQSSEDSEDDEEEDNTMSQIRGIDGIQTPLFNPTNLADDDKINTLVRKNFMGENVVIPTDLASYVTKGRLVDMLDFSRTSFTKEFKTSFASRASVKYRWKTTLLEDLLLPIEGTTERVAKNQVVEQGLWPVVSQEADSLVSGYTNMANPIQDIPLILFGDHSCTVKYVDFPFFRGADGTQLIKTSESKGCLLKYLYYYLSCVEIENSGKYERHFKYLKKQRVPLPPLDIQKKIVEECQNIDVLVVNGNEQVQKINAEIETILNSVTGKKQPLKAFVSYGNGRISYADIKKETFVSTDNMLQNCEGIVPYDGVPNVSNVVAYNKGDILLSNIRPYLKKLWLADSDGGCSPDVLVLHNTQPLQVDSTFVYYSLRRQTFFDFIMSDIKGMKMPRGKKETIEKFEIVLPSLEVQREIVEKLRKYDAEIANAKQQIASAPSRKQAILDKYLK